MSSFMPNRLMPWNVPNNVGNPSKSIEITDMIKVIKKKEVPKEGKASTAQWPLQHDEYAKFGHTKELWWSSISTSVMISLPANALLIKETEEIVRHRYPMM
jgi:hypothetical protein